jgi:hypothetical protein
VDGQVKEGTLSTMRESIALVGLLVATFALRAIAPGQPIVENYVGRQVPTAMVARNLERGSGFLRPQLETAPYPNLFLVEPPIYAATVVGLRQVVRVGLGLNLALEPAGRLVSALATTLGAWGLFGLVRRREGSRTALIAVAALAIFPLTIRYGRAFQPDALMLGAWLAGLRSWDEFEASGRKTWLLAAVPLIATGLAVKIISAYMLVPLGALVRRTRHSPGHASDSVLRFGLVPLMVLPALLWYVHAAVLIWQESGVGSGSRAAADNGRIWLRVLIPTALLNLDTLRDVVRFVLIRGFTPLGLVLAAWGLRGGDRLWRVWLVAVSAGLAVLAGKLHHEYYWLVLAPLAAVGVGRALAGLAGSRPGLAAGVGCALIGLALVQARTTWQTPAAWRTLPAAAGAVRSLIPPGALVVAPEALLYAADRRGCRLELSASAARRAAGEWGATLDTIGEDHQPLALVEFYQARGARFVALPGVPEDGRPADPLHLALQEAIRRRYNVLIDRADVLIAALDD